MQTMGVWIMSTLSCCIHTLLLTCDAPCMNEELNEFNASWGDVTLVGTGSIFCIRDIGIDNYVIIVMYGVVYVVLMDLW